MSLLREFSDLRPFGGFDFIMADPPWRFGLWSERGQEKSPDAQYQTMTLADIKAMPVGEALAADNCMLWLWATHPMLPHALEVMAAWGFTFKTSGVWAKRTKHGKLAFGTGYVLRCASEPFLIGVRGKGLRTARNVRTVIEGPLRSHSQKPDEAFRAAEALLPERLYPDGVKRLELFSRTDRPGWQAWGNEVGTIPLEGAA